MMEPTTIEAIVAGVRDTIEAVPIGRFALLLVTEDEIDIRAVPDAQLENLLHGIVEERQAQSIVAKRDGLLVAPGYREHLVILFEISEIDAPWEPPNVAAVGATIATASRAARGEA